MYLNDCTHGIYTIFRNISFKTTNDNVTSSENLDWSAGGPADNAVIQLSTVDAT